MKTTWQWASLCAFAVALVLSAPAAMTQTVPSIQGTSVPDPAIPVLITPAPAGSGFFILNQDFSLMQHSLVDASQNQSCTGPGIYSRTIQSPRTLVTDLYNAYMTGPDGIGANTAIDAQTPEVSCVPVQAFDYTGGLATQSLAANDPQHALYYTVSAFGGNVSADQLLVLHNLNYGTVASTNQFSEVTETSLDFGGVYTSIVSDTRSGYGLTAITELKTSTSSGNLWIYNPVNNTVYKILGPGGTPLPAVTSFLIPSQTDSGGSLLVLVNQDGLTASNITAPPLDATPFTIIDLGQLLPLFQSNPPHNTITLPFVTQIQATTPFYAMLGGAYNPLDHRAYVVVAGGTSTSSVVENVLSYDVSNPAAPGEQVVADVSNVAFSLGSYPQLALNAASQTMQILTSNPSMLYSVGISGTGNTAVAVPGSTFPDPGFAPTYIAANPLQGETYIASSSGQIDVLTRPTTLQGGLALTLNGSDLGYTSQEYQVTPLALWPVYDPSLATAALTITVTPDGGSPAILATAHVSNVGYPGGSFFTYNFPGPGRYTIVATAAASALYPAVTSAPLYVYVGNTGVYPTVTSLSIPSTVPAPGGSATLNATVTLTGTTYAPSGQVYIQDPTGAEVGNIQLPRGAIVNPLSIPITINQGVQTLTAVYSGDEQNQSSKSAPQTITAGTVARVTPTFTLTLPSTAVAGASVAGNLKFNSTSTTAPTGTVTIYATLSGTTTANQVATVPAAQAFATGGANFNFTAPTAGDYTFSAGYGGDTNYTNAFAGNTPLTVTGVPLQTTTVGLVAPATASPGVAFNLVVGFNVYGAFTTQPTGNIVVTATTAGGSTLALGTITPAQGMAPGGGNLSVTLPNAGVYNLYAAYAGDSLYAASNNTATVTVVGIPTTLSLTAGATQTAGTTFTANVALSTSGSAAAPTGNITVSAVGASGSPFIVATVTMAQARQTGGYNAPIALPGPGTYTLRAVYPGDSVYSSSAATLATVTVAQATASVGISGVTSQVPGVAFPITVRLTPQTGVTATPSGNVVITSTPVGGGTTTTLATVTAAQALTSGGYQAQVTLPAAGSFTVTATYAGDTSFTGSSASLIVSATPTATIVLRPTQSPVYPNVPFILCVDITSTTTTAPPSGSINISELDPGGTPFALTPLLASATVTQTACTTTLTEPNVGSYAFTATYAGDSNYPPLTTTLTLNLQLDTTSINLLGSANAIALSPYQLMTKLVTHASNPQGLITISASSGSSSTPVVTTTIDALMATSTITSFLTFPTAGTYTVTASYPGNNSTTPSTATLNVVVAPPPPTNFTMTLDDPTVATMAGALILNRSGKKSTTLTLTAAGTGPGPVTLSATGQLEEMGYVVFRDPTTMQLITSATPTVAGTKVVVEFDNPQPTAELRFPDLGRFGVGATLACGLLGLPLWFRKRSRLRNLPGLYLAGAIVFIVTAASVVAGCGTNPVFRQVQLTATPVTASAAAPPQSTSIYVSK
jgi:hypothetical protein